MCSFPDVGLYLLMPCRSRLHIIVKSKLFKLFHLSGCAKLSPAPEFLCTHIWASLQVQTLYRAISGMIYSKAFKLLYRVETPNVVGVDKLERKLELMTGRKFKLVVSMRRQGNVRAPSFCCAHIPISKSAHFLCTHRWPQRVYPRDRTLYPQIPHRTSR